MEETNKKNGGIDTRRVGGRPKLARYERRNHHHKVSYNDEEENIIQYKAEQAGKPDARGRAGCRCPSAHE